MRILLSILTLLCFTTAPTSGQTKNRLDTLDLDRIHLGQSKFINNIFQQALNSIKKDGGSDFSESYMRGKSETPYLPYTGKIIRKIEVEVFNFDRSFNDTSARDNSFAARVAKRLHKTTREFVVRDNLFIKEKTPLNAYKVADNERFLRTLEYIQDARIIVKPVKGKKDSVDVIVYVKDLFSIAGGASSQVLNHIHANVYETNLAGMAQRLELNGLYDKNRQPNADYGALYRKNNIAGTFIDGTAAYNRLNVNRFTAQEETQELLNLNRRLVSPYSRMAGSLTFANSEANNVYNLPEHQFFRYRYHTLDGWVGYNIAIRQLTATNNGIRDRRFFALRYFNRVFDIKPKQVDTSIDPFYNNTQAVLGQITFFRQDYFKTQYIYGFGTTEDLPYGYNIAVTAGWHKQEWLERPYAGITATDYIATNYGDFIRLYLKAGGFLHDKKIQDGSLLIGATAYSRIIFWNSTKIRQFINASYTNIHNRLTTEPLALNNFYGLRGFLSDSVQGNTRFTVQLETEFFLKPRLFGFKFAPFPYADLAVIGNTGQGFRQLSLYSSIGGGVRARNENLVFETIELRGYYFPVSPAGNRDFKVILTANVRFRYSSNYVTAPEVVLLNQE